MKNNGSAKIIVILLALAVLGVGVYLVAKDSLVPPLSISEKPKGLKDEAFIGLIEEFTRNRFSENYLATRLGQGTQEELENLVLDSLKEGDNVFLKERFNKINERLDNILISDAPDLRALARLLTKRCVAESFIVDSPQETVTLCGFKDIRPDDVAWDGETLKDGIDDILADAQILPYFIAGVAYLSEDNNEAARYYFRQIVLHRDVLSRVYGDAVPGVRDLYKKIVDRASEYLKALEDNKEG